MDKLLDIPGLAARWGVSEDQVRALVKQRRIPFTRLPGTGKVDKLVRFTPEQVATIEAAGEQPALNGSLAGPHLRSVTGPRPPAGPSTPPPPSGPATPSKQRGRAA